MPTVPSSGNKLRRATTILHPLPLWKPSDDASIRDDIDEHIDGVIHDDDSDNQDQVEYILVESMKNDGGDDDVDSQVVT